jgi:hypothetical protein
MITDQSMVFFRKNVPSVKKGMIENINNSQDIIKIKAGKVKQRLN